MSNNVFVRENGCSFFFYLPASWHCAPLTSTTKMKRLKIFTELIRLRTLPVSVSGVLIALALAKWSGAFRLAPALLCIAFAVLAQIVSNLANEYYDYLRGTDKVGRDGPRRGVTEGDIAPATLKRAMWGTLALTMAVGLCTLLTVPAGDGYANWLAMIALGALVAAGALAYSTGPYPLSYHALGEPAVLLFYGVVPVIGTHWVVAGHISAWSVMAGIAVGLMGVNVLLVNNYRDADDDRQAGKITSVVKFGRPAAAMGYLLNGWAAIAVMGALWIRLLLDSQAWTLAAPAAYLAMHSVNCYHLRHWQGAQLNKLLGATARTMLIFTILLALGLWWQ